MDGSTRHRLLLSVPDLGDANFDQTVVYMVDHDEAGAFGVVLNRPSDTVVAEHLPDLAVPVLSPSVFFVGGPVSVGGLLAIGRRAVDAEPVNAALLSGPIAIVDPEALLGGEVSGLDAVRLFTGYSGWGPGQLDGELATGAWHVADAMVDDVLCAEPALLWRTVMRRQGGRLVAQGLYPEDPSVN
ncbi:MAG: YqgE/AlgH family protein [Actinobacteria bacterium]|nr:YqgE/AlgH family protein [Actinomycetota bacterium]